MPGSDGPLAVRPLADEPGVEIIDRIEQERCRCRTAESVTPRETDRDPFRFPVDRAVALTGSTFSFPNVAGVLVRDDSGDIVAQVQQLESAELDPGRYNLELLTQFKAYLSVESRVEVTADATEFRIDLGSPSEVVLGARSNHDRPAATVTTTADPIDMMAAVETFGSALKTTAPDRAFPSLRGHPPAVELGESLDVPSSLERPDTGVELAIPASREAVYVAAPLAYYLGADVVPATTPMIRTADGFEYSLSGPDGYERAVERTLKQVFFLDCVTRTEGLYGIDLHERAVMDRVLDLDVASLYDRPLAAQLEAYLDVPYDRVADHVPEWKLTTHVEPAPSTMEQLPYVVDDLAVVRTRSGRAVPNTPAPAGTDSAFTRSADSQAATPEVDYVEPEASDSLEQAWIGDDIPIGASKLTREAFENRLEMAPVDGDISISIVLNDPRMDEERDLADRAYGNRENLPFDVNVSRDATTDELREILQTETAFLHYIGHTEHDGFECPDGKLDARTLESTGVQAFLLNACHSYEQGLGLIDAGAVGGIVTLSDVINDGAVRIGETMARLLNAGFPLRAALTIAREESILGGQYIVAGDGGMTVAQPASGTPYLLEIESDGESHEVEIETYPTDVSGLGSVFKPRIQAADRYYLSSGVISSFTLDTPELLQFLQLEDIPIRHDSQIQWSSARAMDLL